jgi:mono/diheme cytochrome c family protein
MPAFRTSLTRRQIADIATFLARATASAPAD